MSPVIMSITFTQKKLLVMQGILKKISLWSIFFPNNDFVKNFISTEDISVMTSFSGIMTSFIGEPAQFLAVHSYGVNFDYNAVVAFLGCYGIIFRFCGFIFGCINLWAVESQFLGVLASFMGDMALFFTVMVYHFRLLWYRFRPF